MSKEQLSRVLFAMLGSNVLVNRWWKSPNKAFGMKNPNEIWEVDQKKVEDYIMLNAMR